MQSSTTIKGGCHGPNGDADYPNGLENFNMWTGYATQSLNQPRLLDISGYTCVLGLSRPQDFQDLCYFSCFRGYCPPSACNCNLIGPSSTINPEPGKTPGPGYPVRGRQLRWALRVCLWERLLPVGALHVRVEARGNAHYLALQPAQLHGRHRAVFWIQRPVPVDVRLRLLSHRRL
ncbi:hypothetical protein BR93DRAFT_562309 [Coniochaeta sp. PMI_546]|nr:hypothetical protein BR93DRAFT_562309 [Coniochaeta sp. PMI_546]